MPRAAFHQPFGEHFAEAAERAGDQVTAVRLDGERRRERFAAPRHERLREGHDDFADVLAARHEPEGRVDAARREGTEGQRRERAFLDQFGELAEHLPRQRFVAAEDGVHRDDVERGIAPQRPERDARVLVDVAFADLDEAAELREAREPHRDRLGGERVEHDVHAAPVGEFHHGFGEVAAPRVDHVLHAERLEQRALGRAAGARR